MAVNNAIDSGAAIVLGGTFTMTGGAFTFTGTLSANTAVTFPTSGTLLSTSTYPAPGAAAGKIIISDGAAWVASTPTFPNVGTSTGSFLYADGTNWVASTSLWANTVGSAGVILRSNGTSNAYSTSTFADTYAINSIPYASAANTITALAPALSSVMISSAASTGVPAWSGALTNGQLIIGSTGATPAVAGLTAGTGITIGTGAGSITINATGGGVATATIAGTTQTAVVNTQYIALNAGQTTVTLPATYAVGDVVILIGSTANTGGWILDAPAGDTIRVLAATTSAGGTVTSTAQAGECIEVVCDVADTSWVVRNFVSTLLTTA